MVFLYNMHFMKGVKVMKLLKGLFSGTCLVLVAAGTGICLYELYNSFISPEPKNVITYHLATSGTTDKIDTTYVEKISDGFDDSSFSSSDTIRYNTSNQNLASEVKTDASAKNLIFEVNDDMLSENTALCALIDKDDNYFYFITDSSLIGDSDIVYINLDNVSNTSEPATVCNIDRISDTAVLTIEKSSLSISIASKLNSSLSNFESDNNEILPGSPVIYITQDADGSYVYNYGNVTTIIQNNSDSEAYNIICTDFNADLSYSGILTDISGNVIGIYTEALLNSNISSNTINVLSYNYLLTLSENN
jgi:hypothetical protein